MDINSLYHKARTIRLFTKEEVSQDAFHTILENVRVASNATNRQTLRYIVIKNPELVSAINNSVIYASLLPQKSNSPQLDQFPPYYIGIVQTQPSAISDIDTGIAADVIKTSAASMNLGACIMASFKNLDTLLHIKDKERLRLIIALGYPAHQSPIVEYKDDFRYYKDENDDYYVPKKPLDDIITFL